MPKKTTKTKPAAPKSWRDVYAIHPVAEIFPMMGPEELKALAADIKQNGLLERVVIDPYANLSGDRKAVLWDGRNRLDAMELAGLPTIGADGKLLPHIHIYIREDDRDLPKRYDFNDGDDDLTDNAYRFVVSANAHRRHLTTGQKKEAIRAALKHMPGQSDRAIGARLLVDSKTVAKERRKLEATAEIPQLKTRRGKDGKERRKPELRVIEAQQVFGSPQEAHRAVFDEDVYAAHQQDKRDRREAAQLSRDQDEAAKSVAISLRDNPKPVGALFAKAEALAAVAEHMRPDRRKLMAASCRIHAQAWEALAAKFDDKDFG